MTIPANATSATVTVVANGDTLNEANETFFVDLTGNPSGNATILDARGIGTINNNDAAPKISIGNAVVTEDLAGAGGMLFSVTLSAASGQPISVTYATSDGTAVAGLDYAAAPATVLTFAPGSTPSAIFTVSLSAPSSNTVTVSFQTADGAATAGSDYQAQSGTLTMPAGATSRRRRHRRGCTWGSSCIKG